jgi:hypothetical protein
VKEAAEICRAVLKKDEPEIIDVIGNFVFDGCIRGFV